MLALWPDWPPKKRMRAEDSQQGNPDRAMAADEGGVSTDDHTQETNTRGRASSRTTSQEAPTSSKDGSSGETTGTTNKTNTPSTMADTPNTMAAESHAMGDTERDAHAWVWNTYVDQRTH